MEWLQPTDYEMRRMRRAFLFWGTGNMLCFIGQVILIILLITGD